MCTDCILTTHIGEQVRTCRKLLDEVESIAKILVFMSLNSMTEHETGQGRGKCISVIQGQDVLINTLFSELSQLKYLCILKYPCITQAANTLL